MKRTQLDGWLVGWVGCDEVRARRTQATLNKNNLKQQFPNPTNNPPPPNAMPNMETDLDSRYSRRPSSPDTHPRSSPGVKSIACGVGVVWPSGYCLISGMSSRAYSGGYPAAVVAQKAGQARAQHSLSPRTPRTETPLPSNGPMRTGRGIRVEDADHLGSGRRRGRELPLGGHRSRHRRRARAYNGAHGKNE